MAVSVLSHTFKKNRQNTFYLGEEEGGVPYTSRVCLLRASALLGQHLEYSSN